MQSEILGDVSTGPGPSKCVVLLAETRLKVHEYGQEKIELLYVTFHYGKTGRDN